MPGYEENETKICTQCEIGSFKQNYGNNKCKKCTEVGLIGSHTTTRHKASTKFEDCICDMGYFDQDGVSWCKACPIGKYNDEKGRKNDCKDCPWQTLAPEASTSEKNCQSCKIDSYPNDTIKHPYPTTDNPKHWIKCNTIQESDYKSCDSTVDYHIPPDYPDNQHGTIGSVYGRGHYRSECEDPELLSTGNIQATWTNVCGRDQSFHWARKDYFEQGGIFCTCKPGMFYHRKSCDGIHFLYYCLNPLTQQREGECDQELIVQSCNYGYTTLTMDGRFKPRSEDLNIVNSLDAEGTNAYIFDEHHSTNEIYKISNYNEEDHRTWMKYTGAVEAEYNRNNGGCEYKTVDNNQHACGMQPTRMLREHKEDYCFPCSPGTYQETKPGNDNYGFCVKCPEDTYTAETGEYNRNYSHGEVQYPNPCKNVSSPCHKTYGTSKYNGATGENYTPRDHCMKTFHNYITDNVAWSLKYELGTWKLIQSDKERASIVLNGDDKIAENINDKGIDPKISIKIQGNKLEDLDNPGGDTDKKEYCTKQNGVDSDKICDNAEIGCSISGASVILKCTLFENSAYTFTEMQHCAGGWMKEDTKLKIKISDIDSCTHNLLFAGEEEFKIEDKIINGNYVWESKRDGGGTFQLVKSSEQNKDKEYELWLIDGNDNETYPETTNWLQQYGIGPKWLGSVNLGDKKLKNVPGCPEEESITLLMTFSDEKCKRIIYKN